VAGDATLVVLAEERDKKPNLTLDCDFGIDRIRGRVHFELLPQAS